MAKVNISLPDGLLEEIDAAAAEAGTSRSGFLQEAGACYLARLEEERAARERSERIGAAIEKMREVAEQIGEFDGTVAIREDRDRGHRELS